MSKGSSQDATPSNASLLLGTIGAAGFLNASLGAGRLILPLITLQMGGSAFYAGIVAAQFSSLAALFSIHFGRWVDIRGTRLPVTIATLMVFAGAGLMVISPHLWFLPLSAALIGGGAMFSHICTTRAVGGIGTPSQRSRNLSTLVTVYSLTQFTGPLLTAFILEDFGAVGAMAAIGVLALAAAATIYQPIHNFTANADRNPAGGKKVHLRELFALPQLRFWLLICSTFMAVAASFPLIVALQSQALGLSPLNSSYALGAFWLGTFVARAIATAIGGRIEPVPLVLLSLLGSGMAYGAMIFSTNVTNLVVVACLIGLTLGMGNPLTLSLIYATAPEGRVNEAIGASLSLSCIFQTVMPLLMGVTAAWLGIGPVLICLAVALIISAIIAYVKTNAWR